jgi:Na+/H+ antiporter NhaC
LAFEKELSHLSPGNDAQRSLQSRATQSFTDVAQIRLQLFTQSGGSIPVPFLIILVFWLSAIFVSSTLFARTNVVVMASLFVCALSFSCAIFLVLELDSPFTGLMRIPSATLRGAPLPVSSASSIDRSSP